jgi:hypothetical protein
MPDTPNTYKLDIYINSGEFSGQSIDGFIQTDGALGFLQPGDITAFSFTFYGIISVTSANGHVVPLTSLKYADATGTIVVPLNSVLYATAADIEFRSQVLGAFEFIADNRSPYVAFGPNTPYSDGPGGWYGTWYRCGDVGFTEGQTIAWAVVPSVPEPTTWAMLLTGFALLGGWRWQLRHSVQKN